VRTFLRFRIPELPAGWSTSTEVSSLCAAARFTFPRVWRAGPGRCVILIVLTVLVAALSPVSVYVLGRCVEVLRTSLDKDPAAFSALTLWIGLAIAAVLLNSLAGALNGFFRAELSQRVARTSTAEFLAHAERLDLATFEDPGRQDIIARAKKYCGSTYLTFVFGWLQAGASFFESIALLGILFWIAPICTAVLLGTAVPVLAVRTFLSRTRHRVNQQLTPQQRRQGYYAGQFTSRKMMVVMQLLGLGPLMRKRVDELLRSIHASQRSVRWLDLVVQVFNALVVTMVIFAVVVVVSRRVLQGQLTLEQFVVYWAATWKFQSALKNVSIKFSSALDARWRVSNVEEYFNLEPISNFFGRRPFTHLRHGLCVENLSFAYHGAQQPVLSNVSIEIRQGETLAIVGDNGAGKTTLAKIIAGLYQPTEGRVTVDGIDLADLDIKAYQARGAFVLQTPAAFEATAFENLAFGDWRRLLDDPAAVAAAAHRAGVDELIEELPQGYDTMLGRRFGEHDFSAGQWRRIDIARAMMRDPTLVILDEPAANLDVHSQHCLYTSIRSIMQDRTMILISHRLSCVQMADRIAVLESGSVVEIGSHAELLRRGGAYARIVKKRDAIRQIQNTPARKRIA